MCKDIMVKSILGTCLKCNYSNFEVVSAVSDFCKYLDDMADGEIRNVPYFDMIVLCEKSVNGYDEEITEYKFA